MIDREIARFALRLVRSDGRLGPNLRQSTDECRRLVPRPDVVPPGAMTTSGCGTIDDLARAAAARMSAPVVNETGLTGLYEFFIYTVEELPRSLGGVVLPAGSSGAPDDISLPTYSTALREQLGLKLDPAKGLARVLMIDSVSRPTPN